MRILQVSAEIFPILKTGGLADVTGALPGALVRAGCDVRALLPGFPAVMSALADPQFVGQITMAWNEPVRILRGYLSGVNGAAGGLPTYVLDAPRLYDRPGNPYEDEYRQPYSDNHRRFAALGWAAAHVAYGLDPDWAPEVVHGHDWHAGLAAACLRTWGDGRPRVPCVFTVHNLAYQGLFAPYNFGDLGLPAWMYRVDGVEFYGQISFMKAGLNFSDQITTVSPTYALEIQSPEQGWGLDGLLRWRRNALRGILNGVDETVWDPASDPLIGHPFEQRQMRGKAACKHELQRECGLAQRSDAPLFAVVSRLTEQKGLPLVLAAVDEITGNGGQLLVLGSGDYALEQAFAAQARQRDGEVALHLGYNEVLAHRVFAGSDISLVPSLFEPCGLTQMYGLKYGSLPLVRRVGGLADTVVDTDLASLADRTANGFVFGPFTEDAYRHAVRRAFALFRRRTEWARVRQYGMGQSFGWDEPAAQYVALYRQVIGE